jgi:hypothetical protein
MISQVDEDLVFTVEYADCSKASVPNGDILPNVAPAANGCLELLDCIHYLSLTSIFLASIHASCDGKSTSVKRLELWMGPV